MLIITLYNDIHIQMTHVEFQEVIIINGIKTGNLQIISMFFKQKKTLSYM